MNYYVSNDGDNSNLGTSPEAPLKTIAKINKMSFEAGDCIFLKRGDVFKHSLILGSSGTASNKIKVAPYGEGTAKPIISGYIDLSNANQWVEHSSGIWRAELEEDATPINAENLLSNGSFDTDLSTWNTYTTGGGSVTLERDTVEYVSSPASLKFTCISSGDGTSSYNVLLRINNGQDIIKGHTYILSFKAKCTSPFVLPSPRLVESDLNRSAIRIRQPKGKVVGSDWTDFECIMIATGDHLNVSIHIPMGGIIPDGAILNIDNVRLDEYDTDSIFRLDIGFIKADGDIYGEMGISLEETTNPYAFYTTEGCVYWVMQSNPASVFTKIEVASRMTGVRGGSDHVEVNGLEITGAGVHGIQLSNKIGWRCRLNTIHHIGGCIWRSPVRLGNGIEVWQSGQDHRFQYNDIYEIYDVALTNQGGDDNLVQDDIIFSYNKIWNCEQSFETWLSSASAIANNIYYTQNICLNSGYGWGHAVRSSQNGCHVLFYTILASVENFYITNNVFYRATEQIFRFTTTHSLYPISDFANMVIDNNYIYQDPHLKLVRAGLGGIPEIYPDRYNDIYKYWGKQQNGDFFIVDGDILVLEYFVRGGRNMARINNFVDVITQEINVVTLSENSNIQDSQDVILADSTTGNITLNLFSTTNRGKALTIKKVNAANTVTIDSGESHTIEGVQTLVLSSQYASVQLAFKSGVWYKLA